ncbi:MAG TPA: 3-hydroxyacyl-CoA dehydrogenase NAD-binding domain-containing protein, partial [Planctomycetota bacterium]|nr:3-hydroxyacyl-CoA dehydrogenase NAD-binding domain-containing protein [Planctomycetota bacterium]
MRKAAKQAVAVYGCGTIGASWAALFASRGDLIREVRMYDITPEATA